jgi:hypothetical protein
MERGFGTDDIAEEMSKLQKVEFIPSFGTDTKQEKGTSMLTTSKKECGIGGDSPKVVEIGVGSEDHQYDEEKEIMESFEEQKQSKKDGRIVKNNPIFYKYYQKMLPFSKKEYYEFYSVISFIFTLMCRF